MRLVRQCLVNVVPKFAYKEMYPSLNVRVQQLIVIMEFSKSVAAILVKKPFAQVCAKLEKMERKSVVLIAKLINTCSNTMFAKSILLEPLVLVAKIRKFKIHCQAPTSFVQINYRCLNKISKGSLNLFLKMNLGVLSIGLIKIYGKGNAKQA